MKVLMTGATGLVGTGLTQALVRDGHTVCRMVRRETVSRKSSAPSQSAGPRVIDVPWDPEASDGLTFADSQGEIAGAEAVVNLAGASIAEGRWTQQRKMVLRSSRVRTTRALVTAIGRLKNVPRVLISASAIGYYGDRGDEVLTEESKPGNNFLARIAMEWEVEAKKAEALGIRVVLMRFGVILAKHGGALPVMMKPFRFFVGGKIGSGRQWISWITLEDVIGIMRYALNSVDVSGVMNVVAPQPVRNAEFTRELARAMHRPAVFPAPAFALRLALGAEMADSLLLASARVEPARLAGANFTFRHPDLRPALQAILGPH
jgi:uncharacterized protein (TIGR01777 family)